MQAGGLVIIDYKTGRLPHAAEVAAGLAPQLPLEAAMALAGAFREVPGEAVAELAFWRLSGGTPAGEECRIEGDVQELARSARAGLLALIERFDDEATPYAARPRPEVVPAFSDYEHLARVKEWSAGELGRGRAMSLAARSRRDPHADQRLAADPAASVWVAASAGTGKTTVLANRVLSLLLADTPPERILCLTFTKAAAAEMANRVAHELGAWATIDDAELAKRLTELNGMTPEGDALERARRLFAQVVDAPEGLQDRDHPRLLPIPPAPLPARGGTGAALRGAG